MRSALSMRVSGNPSAVSTGLLCPFAHAEPLDTYTPISESRLSTGSERMPGIERLTIYGSASGGELIVMPRRLLSCSSR